MLKRFFSCLAFVVLLGLLLFALKSCSNLQGPIPPAENGTQYVWVVYLIISICIIIGSCIDTTKPSKKHPSEKSYSHYSFTEDSPKRKYLKRFFIRLTIVVFLGILLYFLKAYDNPEALTSPPWVILVDGITWEGWLILIVGVPCILFIGLKHEPVDYSNSTSAMQEEDYYHDVEPPIGEGYSDDSCSGSSDEDSNSTKDDQ